MLPGMGAGPTTNVNGRRPALDRARPGVPPHIRRRRARFAVAVVLLLAITIGAIGWWLGSGRWTDIPELVGKDQAAAIDLLQEAGLDPDCCEEVWSEEVAAGAVMSTEPARAARRSAAPTSGSWSPRAPSGSRVPTDLVGKPEADGRGLPAGRAARDPGDHRAGVRRRRRGRAWSSASTRPPAPS